MEYKNLVSIHLISDTQGEPMETLKIEADQVTLLPRLNPPHQSFLGWNFYEKLNYGFMNCAAHTDSMLYAIYTKSPAYIIESYFRGDPNDYTG